MSCRRPRPLRPAIFKMALVYSIEKFWFLRSIRVNIFIVKQRVSEKTACFVATAAKPHCTAVVSFDILFALPRSSHPLSVINIQQMK